MRVLAEVMDSLMVGHVGRAGIMAQRFRALEYVATEGGSWSKAKHLELAQMDGATSLTPGLRGDMNRQARRDQRWTGRPSSWGSREQDQNPSRQGAKGAAKGGPPWKSREGNQFGKGNKKGTRPVRDRRANEVGQPSPTLQQGRFSGRTAMAREARSL